MSHTAVNSCPHSSAARYDEIAASLRSVHQLDGRGRADHDGESVRARPRRLPIRTPRLDKAPGNIRLLALALKGSLLGNELPVLFKEGAYQNQWWAMAIDGGARTLALVSFGNLLFIDRERNVVMAQLATQRVNADIPIQRLQFAMLAALLGELDR